MKKHLILAAFMAAVLVPFAVSACGDSEGCGGKSGDKSGGSDSSLTGSTQESPVLLVQSGKKPEKPADKDSGSKTNAPSGSDKKKA